eukprot:2199294-Prymnesium_polylepis.1
MGSSASAHLVVDVHLDEGGDELTHPKVSAGTHLPSHEGTRHTRRTRRARSTDRLRVVSSPEAQGVAARVAAGVSYVVQVGVGAQLAQLADVHCLQLLLAARLLRS